MIKFNDKEPVPLNESKSLLVLALENNIELNHSCGGYGTCGTCRVLVENYVDLPGRNEIESEMANDRGFNDQERLACQTKAGISMQIKTP